MVLIVLTVLPGTGVLTSQAAAVDQDPRSFVASYFAAIDQALMPLGPSASLRGKYDLMSQSGQSLASYQAATAASFQHWIAAHGDTYHAISTELANMSVVQSINAATIDVRATTTMIWTPNLVPPPDGFSAEKAASMAEMESVGRVFGANDEVTSEVATDHHIELSQKGGEWFVVSDSYLDWFNQKLAPDHATPRAAPAAPAPSQQSGVHVEPETAPSGNSMTYNRIAALTYADMYATSYNPNYYNYNPDGGDCANFVSQALYDPVYGANLPREDPNWYYLYGQSGAAASPIAWRYTPSQHQFLINNPYGSYYDFGYFGTSGSWSATNAYDKSYMLTGDIHFYDWYSDGLIRHATIAVGYLGDGTTLIDSHNLDRKRVRYDFDASYDNGTTYYMDRMNHTINY